jgi:acyl-CoA synthetase (AMP-forming)/AMP-acid ligase II/acyl carrier protein
MDLATPVPVPGDLQLQSDQATIVTVLRQRAAAHPGKRAFTFLATGEDESGSLSYGELDDAARLVAVKLQALGLSGKNVLMFYPPGLDFIVAFFGCLYAGTIPATAYPPRKNRSLQRVQTIVSDCGATAILTTDAIARSLERNFSEDPLLASLPWHATDTWPLPEPAGAPVNEPGFEELAFLQYTSGSTGNPKGVMVSHRNIMYNLRSLQMIFQITPEDVAVHWVPQFHDLGLIFGILETVFSGSFTVLIPPFIFIANPALLLQAITRYKATVSGQPDFAFNHCVDKTDAVLRDQLDLSSLRIMYSGAEPVRKSTLDRFLDAFSPAGLKPETLIPAYGMAESTLILTGAKEPGPTVYLPVKTAALEKNLVVPATKDDAADDIRWIAGNGKPLMDTSILIADPDTCSVLPPGRSVGEIWASGSTISMGYFGKPELTELVFRASPAGVNEPRWLRTGDLGFLYNGELFITGRLKDLVIIHGRNFYPQDIEEIVESCHSSMRKTCSAAFSIEHNGRERLAIVAELRRSIMPHDTGQIFDAVAAIVSGEFEIRPVRITLVRTGAIIKTSSGKIMRQANRDALLSGSFDAVADRFFEDQPLSPAGFRAEDETSLEQFVTAWASERLNKGLPVDLDNSLPSYGIDSLRAVELSEEVKNNFGFEWSPYLFFEEMSVRQLVAQGLELMGER